MNTHPDRPSDHEMPLARAILRQGQPSSLPYTLVTGAAGALNLLVILFLCFLVMPRLESLASQATKSREDMADFRQEYISIRPALDEQLKIVRRLNVLLDAAEAKAKALDERKKAKDKDKEKETD